MGEDNTPNIAPILAPSAAVLERLLAHAAPIRFGSFEFEFATETFQWSDGMYQMAGLPIGVPMSRSSLSEFVDHEDLPGMKASIQAAIRSKSVSLYDWHLIRSDGEVRLVRTWFEVMHSTDDRPERIVGVSRDITAEGNERNARIAAERKFHHVMAASTVGIAIVLAHGPLAGTVIDVNDAFVALVGRPRDAIMRQNLISLATERIAVADLEPLLTPGFVGEVAVARLAPLTGDLVRPLRGRATAIDGDTGHPEFIVVHIDDVTSDGDTDDQVHRLVDHDDLTGLLNRRRLRAEFAVLTQRGEPGTTVGSLMLIDVDRFKWVNDSRGHAAGDLLLTQVAEAISEFAAGLPVARLAGDEFAVLMPGTPTPEAIATAEQLRQVLSCTVIDDGTAQPHRVTVTIGVAAVHAGAGLDQALIDADLALYRGKQRGRNRVEALADPEITRRMVEGVSWAEKVREALDSGAFELWQQPIVNLATGAVRERELLVRMVSTTGDVIAAEQFIRAVEDFALARELDAWVIERAAQFARQQQAAEPSVPLAINLSAQSIVDPALATHIDAVFARNGVHPEGIIFEITESAAMSDLDAAERLCRQLRDRGFRISIDDFGVGYGSFTYLRRLPFDYVKIDRSLTSEIQSDPRSRITVEALVLIAKGLGKITIAEGVEDASTALLLERLDVNCGQGHHFGSPRAL